MRNRDDVRSIVEKLYQELRQELRGLEESKLVDEILAEKNQTIEELRTALRKKNQTIEELRTALRTQTEKINRLTWLYNRIAKSFPVRLLRKLGAIDLVKRFLLRRSSNG